VATTPTSPLHRRPWFIATAITVVVAAVAAVAVAWPGFDAQRTPPDDGTVWALQAGEGRRYARVNTVIGELDTVKRVAGPSGIVQDGDRLFVFADGDTRFAQVDPARPADLDDDEDDAFQNTPAGTVEVAAAGTHLVYLTDRGAVFASSLDAPGATVAIDPDAGDPEAEGDVFAATAVAVDDGGTVYAYSAAAATVVRADAATGRILGTDEVDPAPDGEVALSAVAGRWVLLSPEDGTLWIRGVADPIETGATGGVLQQPAPDGDAVHVADATGLVAVPLRGGEPERLVDAAGTPAAPALLDGVVHAAWLGQEDGTRWSSVDGSSSLDYGEAALDDELAPVFARNGSRMILNETRSGWVWTLPDGRLVPSSQQWDLDEEQPTSRQEDVAAERVVDPKPPVAVDDEFGVRAGRSVVLPVLLNDHDPNEDVLAVDPASLEGLDPAFGTVATTNEQQELVVHVAPGATGTATFRYRATDGTTPDGLLSEPATVTLTVAPEDERSAPVWCGVPGCLASWPTPQVAPGGTVAVDVREGWVDPEGDPVYVSSAAITAGTGSLALDAQGTVTYQHPDPNETQAQTVSIALTVADASGLSTPAQLDIAVTPAPELTAGSFALVGAADDPLTVDVGPHVTGATGGVSVRSATVLDESGAEVVVNPLAGRFVFRAPQAGSYVVQYTVADDVAEATGTVRVTLVDPARTQLTTPPLTAFVRPGEDTTIDVVSAVTNPSGLVLLASDLRVEPDAAASLTTDLVGESMIRVTGTTDDGAPGTLGVVRYTVSDGTGNGLTSAEGELTVVLLPAAVAEPPIAVDDAVTVRAGAQIDIPVLENDTAPSGAQISIDPSKIVNDAGVGLAFATGRVLRYLAPERPGTYTVGYTISRLGFPDMTDAATVTITVVADDTNAAPVPRTLVGRVLSGATVSIPFDRFSVDPDGDGVTLDRITEQPEAGSATISATGDAILYTSAPGHSGQVSFGYRVRDDLGATGTGEVRVGVLDAASDPAPVTYSDYLQVQAGADAVARVRPADNDIDPAGGELEVIDVRPNAEVGSAEYDTLDGMLGRVTEDGELTLRAGTELGTYSFAYTVRNGFGDTAIGLIVLKVVREPVPDYPVVRDTVLTAETRREFTRGVDVLDGKVSWNAGDADRLTMRLWGDPPAGVAARGARISGDLPERTLLIPFEVTGATDDGTEVTSYGFLRVPGEDDVQLTLRSSAASVEVDEGRSVEWDMADAVVRPADARIELGPRAVAGGARAQASCEIRSGTTVRYTAGAGAPWTDSCTVPVRLVGAEDYTYLTVQVRVIAENPQPELRAGAITVSPGDRQRYDLIGMTGWAGAAQWDTLRYAVSYAGDQFTVTQEGTSVTVTAKDSARPGRQEPVTVTLASHPDAAPATLQLTVGPAPSTLPKGATVTQTCSQASGNSCTIDVIGAAGEVNPLPGTALRLRELGATSSGVCAGMTFAIVGAGSIQASWSPDADGTRCSVGFTVEDAQGRRSSGDRDGRLTVDLQGFPKAPASVTQIGYGDRSITLRVDPGIAALAYPALEGFRITDGSRVVTTCDADGRCEPFRVDANGVHRSYEARAHNAVGESRQATIVRAWAYRAPVLGEVTAEPVYDPARTGIDTGAVRIRISDTDPEIRSYDVTAAGDVPRSPSGSTEVVVTLPVGTQTVTVTPNSANDAPDGSGSSGGSVSRRVVVAGLPSAGGVEVAEEHRTAITVTEPAVGRNHSDRETSVVYVAFRPGGDFTCTVDGGGALRGASGGVTSTSPTIRGLAENTRYEIGACVGNGYGAAKSTTTTGWAWSPPPAPATATYDIERTDRGGTVEYTATAPAVPARPGFETVIEGWPAAIGAEGGMSAKYCVPGSDRSRCGPARTVTAADPARALQATLSGARITQCVAGSTLRGAIDQLPSGLGDVSIDPATVRYTKRGGASGSEWVEVPRDESAPLTVPRGAERVEADLLFTWNGTGGAGYGVDRFPVTSNRCDPGEPDADETTIEGTTP